LTSKLGHQDAPLSLNHLAGGDVLDGAGKTRGLSIYGEAGIADRIDQSLAWKCQGIRVFPVRHSFFFKRFREGPIFDVLSKTDIRYFWFGTYNKYGKQVAVYFHQLFL